MDLDPTLTEIQGDFTDVSNQIAQVHQQLTLVSGDFNQALGEALGDVGAMNQFVHSAGAGLSNYLAAVITASGDYFTADPAAAKAAIRKQLVLAFLGSALPSNCQQTMRQFLYRRQLRGGPAHGRAVRPDQPDHSRRALLAHYRRAGRQSSRA